MKATRANPIPLSEKIKQTKLRLQQLQDEKQQQNEIIANALAAKYPVIQPTPGVLVSPDDVADAVGKMCENLKQNSGNQLNFDERDVIETITAWTRQTLTNVKPEVLFKNSIPVIANETPNVTWTINNYFSQSSRKITYRQAFTEYLANILKEAKTEAMWELIESIDFKVHNPSGPGYIVDESGNIIMYPSTIRIGCEYEIDVENKHMRFHIYDPIAFFLASKTNLEIADDGSVLFSHDDILELTGDVDYGELALELIKLGKIMYCAGAVTKGFKRGAVRVNIAPLVGTTFTFGFHTSTSTHLGLVQVTDELKTMWAIAAWGQILEVSVSAFYNEGAISANASGPLYDYSATVTAPTQPMIPVKLFDDGQRYKVVDNTSLYKAYATALNVRDQKLSLPELYDVLEDYKNIIDRDPQKWLSMRKQKYARPALGAASKLEAIETEFKIIKDGEILDLGGAPGSWAMWLADRGYQVTTVSKQSKEIPYWDKVYNYPNINLYHASVLDKDGMLKATKGQKFNTVLSDIGKTCKDETQQELEHIPEFRATVLLLPYILKKGGNFVMKMYNFKLKETRSIINYAIRQFKTCRVVKPYGSTPTNSERYVVFEGYQESQPQDFTFDFSELETDMVIHQIMSIENVLGVEQSKVLSSNDKFGLYKFIIDSENCIDDSVLHMIHQSIAATRIPYPLGVKTIPVILDVYETALNDIYLQITWTCATTKIHITQSTICLGKRDLYMDGLYQIDYGKVDGVPVMFLKGDARLLVNSCDSDVVIVPTNEDTVRVGRSLIHGTDYVNIFSIDVIADKLFKKYFGYTSSWVPLMKLTYAHTILASLNMLWFFRGYAGRFKSHRHQFKITLLNMAKEGKLSVQSTSHDYLIYVRGADERQKTCRYSGTDINKIDTSIWQFYKMDESRSGIHTGTSIDESKVEEYLRNNVISIQKGEKYITALSPITTCVEVEFTTKKSITSKVDAHLQRILEKYRFIRARPRELKRFI